VLLLPVLQTKTSSAWVKGVVNNLDLFLLDHASCERKASALAMSFTLKYPDRQEIIDHMVTLSIEELKHFQLVCKLIHSRGLKLLTKEEPDFYIRSILTKIRHGRNERFLDRLIMSALVEARGHERFEILAQNLEDVDLKKFYHQLALEEAGHYKIFIRLAKFYFNDEQIEEALTRIGVYESDAMCNTPLTYRLH
jgi:tRNA 2-(methylsulfanyl)-N6-isopentenyladenosine37 hydroxylase